MRCGTETETERNTFCDIRAIAGTPADSGSARSMPATFDINTRKQDHQALLKAKYCPRVAAVSRTQKTPKNPRELDL